MSDQEIIKKCSKCKTEQPILNFMKDKSTKDGLSPSCKSCYKEYYNKNKKIISKKDKIFYENNREKQIEKSRKYRESISNNWELYLKSAIKVKGREALSLEYVLNLLEKQDYKCALSGVELTCIYNKGYVSTNLSIDRIDPNGPYIEENIQLVCRIVNTMKLNTTDSSLIWWCKKIVEHNG